MTDTACSFAFHIGAHKTATSHLQRSIQTQAAALSARGVHWFGPDQLRKPRQSVPALLGLTAGQAPSEEIASLFKAAGRVVFSEENYIGALNTPRRRPVTCRYPDASQRISAVAQAIDRKIDVFLAVRRPTAFLNAAYCQQLIGGVVTRMAHYRNINPPGSVDWHDLVLRLRAVPGVGEMVVWCHEDYATHFGGICAGLLGASAAQMVKPLDRYIHRSLSAAAVAEVLHRHALREGGDLGFAARRMLPVEDGYPPFDGFSPADHAAGDAAYRRQITAIGAVPGVTLLDPHWARDSMRA
ncbi:hypothetical protein [Yoonia vestfoldensis]|uniref:hypothetical protein n=1 Tax=Yoonia vestfoldensis TaxID=245188 RepID=UPI0003741078|nr:hypothetical protein [Yoonia vestfoldensis]